MPWESLWCFVGEPHSFVESVALPPIYLHNCHNETNIYIYKCLAPSLHLRLLILQVGETSNAPKSQLCHKDIEEAQILLLVFNPYSLPKNTPQRIYWGMWHSLSSWAVSRLLVTQVGARKVRSWVCQRGRCVRVEGASAPSTEFASGVLPEGWDVAGVGEMGNAWGGQPSSENLPLRAVEG